MVTYIIKTTDSDITPAANIFSKEISTGTGTDTSFNAAVGKGDTLYGYFFTPADVPKNDDWEDAGTQTVEIEIITGDINFKTRVRIARYNSSGVYQEAGNWTAVQTLDVSRTFSPVAPTWGSCACGDRIGIEVEIFNDSHANSSVDIGVGTTANEVITDITEDAAACDVTGPPANSAMMMGVGV